MAQIYDLTIDQGTSFKQTFVVKNPDGSNVDLTNYTAKMQFRTNSMNTSVDLEVSDQTSGIQIDVANSKLIISITSEQTSSLKYSRYVYDVKIVNTSNPSTETKRVVQGVVNVNLQVTR